MVTARLSPNDERSVGAHLAACEPCSKRYEQIKFARSAFLRVAEFGLKEVAGPAPRRSAVQNQQVMEFPWIPIGAIILGCICIMAFLFYPRMVQQASATELLSNAMQYEDHAGDAKAFRVQVSGQICAAGEANEKMASFDSSVRCSRALQQIQSTPWGQGNPLSAKTYVVWRNRLSRRHERVAQRDASWEIRTTTDSDAVHAASLELRASDYHATKLTLDFANSEEVSISEDTEPPPTIPTSPIAAVVSPRKPVKTGRLDDPADLLEVQAWTTLHRLNADSGWEATVVRNGSHLRVEAIVTTEERKDQILSAFSSTHDLGLEVHLLTDGYSSMEILPNRARPRGDEPGLAEGWLEQQFPESDARTRFSNDALHLSQQIFGRAFFIDKLQQRQLAMRQCSCAKSLTELVVVEKAGLSGLQGNLYHSLEPLVGPAPDAPSRPLTLVEARNVDMALEDLFSASTGPDEAALDAHIRDIRNLL